MAKIGAKMGRFFIVFRKWYFIRTYEWQKCPTYRSFPISECCPLKQTASSILQRKMPKLQEITLD